MGGGDGGGSGGGRRVGVPARLQLLYVWRLLQKEVPERRRGVVLMGARRVLEHLRTCGVQGSHCILPAAQPWCRLLL